MTPSVSKCILSFSNSYIEWTKTVFQSLQSLTDLGIHMICWIKLSQKDNNLHQKYPLVILIKVPQTLNEGVRFISQKNNNFAIRQSWIHFLAFPFTYVIWDKLFGPFVPVSLSRKWNLSKDALKINLCKGCGT